MPAKIFNIVSKADRADTAYARHEKARKAVIEKRATDMALAEIEHISDMLSAQLDNLCFEG